MALNEGLLALSIGLIFLGLNFLCAFVAERTWGSYWIWLFAFFLLPGISHIFFTVRYFLQRDEMNRWNRFRHILDEPRITGEFGQTLAVPTTDGIEVTPFINLSDGNIPDITGVMGDIPEYARDKQVEELIEMGQWAFAFRIVESKLANAKECIDPLSQRVYEAYFRLIKPKVWYT